MNRHPFYFLYKAFKKRFYKKFPYLQGKPYTRDTLELLRPYVHNKKITLPKHGDCTYDDSYAVWNAFGEVALYYPLVQWDQDMLFYSMCTTIASVEQLPDAKIWSTLLFDFSSIHHRIPGSQFLEEWFIWQARYGTQDTQVLELAMQYSNPMYIAAWWPHPTSLIAPKRDTRFLYLDKKECHITGYIDTTYRLRGFVPSYDLLQKTYEHSYGIYLCNHPDLLCWIIDASLPEERRLNLHFLVEQCPFLMEGFIQRYAKDITLANLNAAASMPLHSPEWISMYGPEYDFARSVLNPEHSLYDLERFYQYGEYPSTSYDTTAHVLEESLLL